MRRRWLILFLLLPGLSVRAGNEDWLEAAVVLTGAASVESLDESAVERFEALHGHPVPLNLASRSRLLSTGLLSAYQVASLADYRARCGDILSAEELALVDGFDPETAYALSCFVSFRSATLPGVPVADSLRGRIRQSLEFRTKGPAGKYRVHFAERAEAGMAWREGLPSFYGVYYGRGRLGKAVAGQFHARFGQGLVLWTGFRVEDLLQPASFDRHAGGISPSWSYNAGDALFGAAADFALGHWDGSVYAAREGAGANAGYTWRTGRAGLTACWPGYGRVPRLGADVRVNLRGIQLFSEVASEPVQGHFAATGGFIAPMGEHLKAALRLRAVPSSYSHLKYGEYAAAASLSFTAGEGDRHRGAFLTDFSALPVPGGDTKRKVLKIKTLWVWKICPSWSLETRLGGRLRNYASERARAEIRTDGNWTDGRWLSRFRLNGDWCDGWGVLSYLEAGRTRQMLSLYLRGTFFYTEGWASRLYAYERDAPGNFNVPAYYGRGFALTLVGAARKSWRYVTLKTWVRLYYLQKKPGHQTGLSLQLSLTI